jgi:hypothetical protein
MPRYMDVVGDELDGDELEGDVMGDVMGEELEGDDEVIGVVKRNPRTGRQQIMRVSPKQTRRLMPIPKRPNWRQQLAPGVIQPDEGMYVLPLTPLQNNGLFTNTVNQITFQGELQKPFRSERLLVGTSKTISTGQGPRLLGLLFVGTDLQGADIQGWDVELIGQANSFGTRLTCKSAEPGVKVRLIVTLSNNFTTTTDTIFLDCQFIGRIIA